MTDFGIVFWHPLNIQSNHSPQLVVVLKRFSSLKGERIFVTIFLNLLLTPKSSHTTLVHWLVRVIV